MDWCLNDPASPSVYVAFDAAEDLGRLSSGLQGRRVAFVASTAAPASLPADLALAVHPELEYVLYDLGPRAICVAKDALPRVLAECRADHLAIREVRLDGQVEPMQAASMTDPSRILAYASGADLVGARCRHPLEDRVLVLASSEQVAVEQGTGLDIR